MAPPPADPSLRTAALVLVALGALVLWQLDSRPANPEPVAPPRDPPRAAAPAPRVARGARVAPPRLVPAQVASAPAAPCLRGAVRSATTGAGIAAAELTFETSKGAQLATTDARGELDVAVPEGSLRLASVTARGFHPWMPPWGHSPFSMRIAPGTCVTGLAFFLTPRAEYTVEVLSPAGAPVPGARVSVHAAHLPPAAPALTDADGLARVEVPDDAVVVARHPAFEPGRAEPGLAAGVTRVLTVVLGRPRDGGAPPPRALAGLVLDGADAGVAGALVSVFERTGRDGGEGPETFVHSLETDEAGRFATSVEDAEAWTVTAAREGLVPASAVTGGEPVTLRLLGGGTLRGAVRDGAGHAVTSFAVILVERIGAFDVGTPRVSSFVDADGRFELRGIAPRVHVVTAVAAGLAASEPAVVEALAPGASRTVELVLRRGAVLTGRVVSRDGGAPLEGARVALEGARDGQSVVPTTVEARTGADGAFSLAGIPPGLRSVLVAASGHHARLLPPAEFREGEAAAPVTVDLGPVQAGEAPRIELVGIGAVLKAEGDALVVREVVPGGGAAEVGVAPGDAIVAIEGVPVAELGFAGGIERIRGPEDTFVRLRVRRGAGVIDATVPRRRIQR